VVPPKQQVEWTELVSTKTGKPIATVSADDPSGFALGLGRRIFGSLGVQWFYEGESLGYRTVYVWIADQDLMITVQTNTQPPKAPTKSATSSTPSTRSSRSQARLGGDS
jgi:D-alanyl-D-alanine carboxypeptidase